MRLVLASSSPRRSELLASIQNQPFEVIAAHVDEERCTVEDPWLTAESLALLKARAVAGRVPDPWVIGGDTVVAVQGAEGFRQLAKPEDASKAAEMLRLLAGRDHLVVTGVALISPSHEEQIWSETTRVTFRPLTDEEIERYVATGSPLDKAGAYGIQDGSAAFVASIDGPLDNVIGLPRRRLRDALTRAAQS